jgi:hypothetical protein
MVLLLLLYTFAAPRATAFLSKCKRHGAPRERLPAIKFHRQTYIPLCAYHRTLFLDRSREFLKKKEIFEEERFGRKNDRRVYFETAPFCVLRHSTVLRPTERSAERAGMPAKRSKACGYFGTIRTQAQICG